MDLRRPCTKFLMSTVVWSQTPTKFKDHNKVLPKRYLFSRKLKTLYGSTAFGLNDRLYDSKVGRQYFSTTAEIVGSLQRLHSKVKQRNFPSPVRGKLPRIQVVLSLFQFLFFRVQVRFHSLKQQINRGIK